MRPWKRLRSVLLLSLPVWETLSGLHLYLVSRMLPRVSFGVKYCNAVLAVKCLVFSHGAPLLQRLLPGLRVLNETLILMHLPSA